MKMLLYFKNLAKELAKSFQVVLLDLRGHGYSDKPRQIDFKEFADDIIQLLDYLYIDESALIGHEMGAYHNCGFGRTIS